MKFFSMILGVFLVGCGAQFSEQSMQSELNALLGSYTSSSEAVGRGITASSDKAAAVVWGDAAAVGSQCIKWNFTISGSEIELLKVNRGERFQGDSVAMSEGKIVVSTTTRNFKDGLVFSAAPDSIVSIVGSGTRCNERRSEYFSISTVFAKGKFHFRQGILRPAVIHGGMRN